MCLQHSGGNRVAGIFAIAFLGALFGVFKPYINGMKRWHFGLAAFASFILVGVFAEPTTKTASDPERIATDTTNPSALPSAGLPDGPPPAADQPASEWSYSTEKDEMRGTESRFAQLDAANTIKLDFPYGEQRGNILVRHSAKFGFDIMVGVPSGQIMCNSFSGSHVNVKFDDGPIQRFGCTDASDGSSNMVFIQGAKGFLRKLKKSKRAVIEAEFFQNGMQQMKFNTENLKWEE